MDEISNTKIESGIYSKGKITLEQMINEIKKGPNAAQIGSIHTFSGIVRNTSKDGRPVKGIKIDAYIELATKSIEEICTKIKNIEGIIDIILIHFYGQFEISEDLIHVVVASSHREEGFKALRIAVEDYKEQLAVWKREDFEDGSSEWIH